MRLAVLSKEQCEMVRQWRNDCLETLRTPYPLTKEQQEDFYRDCVCSRNSPHRYWAIHDDKISVGVFEDESFIGLGGLTNIQWENRLAEISLIIDPELRSQGLGDKAVDLLLAEGFDNLGFKTIFGECYSCNQAGVQFWQKVVVRLAGLEPCGCASCLWLDNRKFWAGKYWSSLYFSIDGDQWRQRTISAFPGASKKMGGIVSAE